MSEYAIIVAGGQGSRLGGVVPKQFMPLQGIPMLMHSMQAFLRYKEDIQLILVLPAGAVSQWEELCKLHDFQAPHQIIPGGKERFHSVKKGLSLVPGSEGLVAVHDAARPLVSVSLIYRCFAIAREFGSAVPAIPVPESIRKLDSKGHYVSVDRMLYRLIQTPQCFATGILKKAYERRYSSAYTDDASVVEAYGSRVKLIEGDSENFKVTWPADLHRAECILQEADI